MSARVLLNLLHELGKKIIKHLYISFSSIRLINSVIQEHKCKILLIISLGPYVGNLCGKLHSNVWLTIGLVFGIFHRPSNTLKTEKFSDFYVRNQ